MNKENQNIVPVLRFPEFENGWEISELGNKKVSFFVSDKTPKEELDIKTYISTENILLNYGGVKKSNKLPNSGSFTTYKNGDILIANIRPYLKKVWFADKEGTASNDVIVFRAGSSISEYFLQHILKNDIFINYVMKGAKGVKMPRGDKSLMKKYPVCFPNPKEQQKIANCLSSLDNVITTETEKLDHLKDHKKGLLQQLFPAKGETKPQFRFPEFEGDGDWEIALFSKYIKLDRGSSPRPINQFLTNDKNGVNWIKIGDTKNVTNNRISKVKQKITLEGSKKSRKVIKGELILANSMSYGVTYELEIEGCIYDGWFVLREYEESFDKQYLLQLLNSDILQKQYKRLAAGGIVQNISSEIVYNTTLPKPSKEEQQKIANCLSGADDLIEAQTTKIEALKAHKKGLMQQLFPNVNDLAI